ncbi:TonB-dependent receptor [Reichenbachiella sp.]|uniref:TonB-dependent receptor n=1 Tax=Reichenbachiella sp. TaxID=2184521 RepID=UPI003B591E9D
MKIQFLVAILLCNAAVYAQNETMLDSIKTVDLKEIVVSSTRATSKTPMTFNEIKKEEIEENNTGKDLPYLLENTPSAVTTSDAGAGVGYTGIRIRGSDAARVNVTLNGIPYNDPESQGVFWVNLPDFASSISSIQVQRGLGTSTNGAGAFGASVNIETKGLSKDPYATIDNAYGSFNTWKRTAMFGTGLIANKFAIDGRLSRISSDGYVDRATSDLKSYFLSGGYYGKKALIKFNIFSGHETTYQAWYGVPESRMNDDVDGMNAYADRNGLSDADRANLLNSGRTYNQYTYDNEVDDYEQTHYQLISAFDLSESITLNVALFLIHGEGYFEQYKTDRDFADYGLNDITIGSETITSTDLIQRRWLNNNFYGTTFSLDYQPSNSFRFTLGGAWNEYDGDHFGRVIWAQFASNGAIRHPYYSNNSLKRDFNIFGKAIYDLSDQLSLFGDLQYRTVDYTMKGNDNDGLTIDQSHNYNFFNPKFGLKYQINDRSNVYASVAIGSKEPVRSDFTDNVSGTIPKAENLTDFEAGYSRTSSKYSFQANFYWMDYKDQLVLTGELNDVGSSLRANVDKSYRAGIELQAGYQLTEDLKVNANATISKNKIESFDETIYNYGVGWDEYNADVISYGETDIAFSPNVVAGGNLDYSPLSGLNLRWIHKYVGEQFLDNTSTDSRKLDAYYISDAVATYTFTGESFKAISLKLAVYNLFNKMYSANGYSWGYRGGGDEIRENFYYPQAGTNFMLGLNIKL